MPTEFETAAIIRTQRSLPMSEAAEAHRLLEEEGVREKLLLTTETVG